MALGTMTSNREACLATKIYNYVGMKQLLTLDAKFHCLPNTLGLGGAKLGYGSVCHHHVL